jgi:hypothetical protein
VIDATVRLTRRFQERCGDVVPERHAADVLGLLTSFETYDQLRNEYDWSFDECEDWIKSVIGALLLEAR